MCYQTDEPIVDEFADEEDGPEFDLPTYGATEDHDLTAILQDSAVNRWPDVNVEDLRVNEAPSNMLAPLFNGPLAFGVTQQAFIDASEDGQVGDDEILTVVIQPDGTVTAGSMDEVADSLGIDLDAEDEDDNDPLFA
jgi:hypothetical protein